MGERAARTFIRAGWFAVILFATPDVSRAGSQDSALPRKLALWDTGRASAGKFSPGELARRSGWKAIPSRRTVSSFKGDAVLSNGRIVVVAGKAGSAAEVYSVGPEGAVPRASLRLVGKDGDPAVRAKSFAIVKHTRGGATLEATYETKNRRSVTARFTLKRGDIFVGTEPGKGAESMRIDCASRFIALPDFFAEDILLDARTLPVSAVEIPSENFVLHFLGDRDAIAMCVYENRGQDVRVTLSGEGGNKEFAGSEIRFGEGKRIWLALLHAPGVWHAADVEKRHARQVMPLAWAMPFPAQWRADFSRADGLTDSWEFLLQKKKGGNYQKPTWLGEGMVSIRPDRKLFRGTVMSVPYPAWTDHEGRGFLQPAKTGMFWYRGPAVIYPINRVDETPADTYTVVDVVRNTLGVGPCEYLLDVENQKTEYKGRATCGVRDLLKRIYSNRQQKQKWGEVEKILDQGIVFVKHIRHRIEIYLEFVREMRATLAGMKKKHPEHAESLDELERLLDGVDREFEERREAIRTVAHVEKMTDEFRKEMKGYDAPDAFDRLTGYTTALTKVGGNQDRIVAKCRWYVKTLRQRAGLMMATKPGFAPLAEEIRRKTQPMLRNPSLHEGGRR